MKSKKNQGSCEILNPELESAVGKTICDWSKKDLEKKSEKLRALTINATHYCRKCGRVANTKKALCKAKSFDEIEK